MVPLVVLVAFLFTLLMSHAGRKVTSNTEYVRAKTLIAEYQLLKKSSPRDKRLVRKLKRLEPEAKRAKRLAFIYTFRKVMVFFLFYVVSIIIVTLTFGFYVVPFDIPGLTYRIEGFPVTPASTVLIASYILFMPLIQKLSEPPLAPAGANNISRTQG